MYQNRGPDTIDCQVLVETTSHDVDKGYWIHDYVENTPEAREAFVNDIVSMLDSGRLVFMYDTCPRIVNSDHVRSIKFKFGKCL